MPELPEVHTITNDIKPYVKNVTIVDIYVAQGYSAKPNTEDFTNKLLGKEIVKADRIAKNIVLFLEDFYVQIHLAMTGKLLLRKLAHPKDNWERVVFTIEKNGKQMQLRFSDMRMFGKVALLDKYEFNELKGKYGPEPIDEKLTPKEFYEQIKSKRTNIKNVLLDQSKIAGLGNVYATDALWIAKIHPETKTQDITQKQAETLLKASREMLNEGIKNRGISMSDYVDAFGKKGKQQEHFRIYQKQQCPTCSTKTEFKKINGRGTYFCPKCQIKGGEVLQESLL